jgi:hypothetical protein
MDLQSSCWTLTPTQRHLLSLYGNNVPYTHDPGDTKRCRLFGSVVDPRHVGTDSDPDAHQWLTDPNPAFFVSGWQDANKNKFFSKLFCLLLFDGTGTLPSIFIDKKSKKSQQNSRNQGFSYFFACWRKNPDPNPDLNNIMTDPDSPKTYESYGSGSPTLLFGLTNSAPRIWAID